MAPKSREIVVSGGVRNSAKGVSSQVMRLTSAGIDAWTSRRARSTPTRTWVLPPMGARGGSAVPGAGQLVVAQVLRWGVDGTLERLVIDHVVGASPEQNAGAAPFSTSVVL